MRRKIEKYLGKKLGIDESQVQPEEDGRYDFMGDFEGVLNAVRGKDSVSGGSARAEMRASRRERTSMSSRTNKGKGSRSSHDGNAGRKSSAPSASYYYRPPAPVHPWMYHPHVGQNVPPNSYPTSSEPWAASGVAPPSATTHGGGLQTPISSAKMMESFQTGSLSSARRTIFEGLGLDSPKSLGGGSLGMQLDSSPMNMDIQGMSPPPTTLKDTFATPMPTYMLPNLSPEEAESLNKSLFSESIASTPFVRTPGARAQATQQPLCINLGDDATVGMDISNMRFANRVSISPISKGEQGQVCTKAGFYGAEEADKNNISTDNNKGMSEDAEKELMPPPTAPRVTIRERGDSVSSSSVNEQKMIDIGEMGGVSKTPMYDNNKGECKSDTGGDARQPTPFTSKIMKELGTPSTAATTEQSFWSDQVGISPVPLSPFKSPTGDRHDAQMLDIQPDEPNTRTKTRPPSSKTGASPDPKRRREVGSLSRHTVSQ